MMILNLEFIPLLSTIYKDQYLVLYSKYYATYFWVRKPSPCNERAAINQETSHIYQHMDHDSLIAQGRMLYTR